MLGGLGLLSVLIALGIGAWIVKLQMQGPRQSPGSLPAGVPENVRPLDAVKQAKDLADKMNERAKAQNEQIRQGLDGLNPPEAGKNSASKAVTASAPQELSK